LPLKQIAICLQEIKKTNKQTNKQTKGKMHNQQATLAHDSFGRVGDVQLTVVERHAASLACQLKLPLKVIIVSFAWFVPDAAAKVDQTRRISNWPLSIKIIESAKQMQTQVKMSE
ncbi:hypothetical protein T10_6698, partial [Trichinella papuae]